MKPIHKTFNDERLNSICVFCGSEGDTRDHVPSKALLVKPFPNDLPVVPACSPCNKKFSVDEEYVGCFIDCVINGSTSLDSSISERTKKAFKRNWNLKISIEHCRFDYNEQVLWKVNEKRFKNILLKLARGHAVFENSEPQLDEPNHIGVVPFSVMKEHEIDEFEALWKKKDLFCEIGSRGFIREIEGKGGWLTVQPDVYRYNVFHIGGRLVVQIVIREFIACEIFW